jgi:hypothetical protein
MVETWGQGVGLTAVHQILSGQANNGDGVQVGHRASYICMASRQMGIARKAEGSIFIHGEPMMVDTQKPTIITGTFHVS